jgi:glycosyltransferase involved in cell wall biosynthesis
MKIIGFAEGARGGNAGLVGTIMILKSTAAGGNSVVLLMGGAVTPGREEFVVADSNSALARKEENGTFGIVSIKASTHWRFCPSILWRFSSLVRSADFVTLHSLYSFPVLAGYLLARLHRKPYGIWPHGVLAPFQRGVSVRKKWLYNKLFADRILQNASVILFSAEGERDETAALRLCAPSVIVPDGFNADEFSTLPERGSFRKRFLNGHTGPLVLFLARVNAKKGVDLLIKAMQCVIAERPDVRLAIVGPPDPLSFNKEVWQWVKENGIEAQTVLTGMADPEMRLEAFADSDIFVLPSYAENFGNSVFEAMACGIPVVVSETLNYAAEFARSGAGFALPRTPEAFSAAIINLIDRPDIQREMGACGKVLARQYSLEETGAKVAKTVECILQQRPLPADLAPIMGAGTSQQLFIA